MSELNPIIVFRNSGEKVLKEKLEKLEIEELKKIVKKYTPDLNRSICREKNKEKIIDYITKRSYHLSRLGQCFRTLDIN